MTWSKREIVDHAFSELALAGYVFDITPEEQDDALKRLDLMMATWAGRGIEVGYQFGESPDDTDLDNSAGVPLVAVQAMSLKLAIEIAAGKGKQLSPSTKSNALTAFNGLLSYLARQKCLKQNPRDLLPYGAGNRRRRYMPHAGFTSESES